MATADIVPPPTADVVGNAFVLQYYHILEQSPEHVYRFYQDNSKFGRPDDSGMMNTVTTMDIINRKIVENGKLRATIVTVDAQESYNMGVFVLVTGFLIGNDSLRKKFTQSFFLAPQDKGGYYVLNDVFRYVDAPVQNGDLGSVADVEAPLTPEHDPSAMQDRQVPEPVPEVIDDIPTENGVPIEEEEMLEPEVIDEIPDDSMVVAESGYPANAMVTVEAEKPSLVEAAQNLAPEVPEVGHAAPVVAESAPSAPVVAGSLPKIEDVPKKSYASIVKVMKESALPFSTPAHVSVRSVPKPQEQRLTAAPAPAPVSETLVSNTNGNDNGNQPEPEAEGHSIYIKGLPLSVTSTQVENEFIKFGPIKTNGVQVRSQKGFGFGFVEFEDASAVQSALEASPVMIGGRQVSVEEKRSTSRGGRGRFPSARVGGYRNEGPNGYRNENGYRNDGPNGYRNDGYRSDGPRGRGGYGGGRGYGRSDFNNKSEFGSRGGGRGGLSGRGGDGYQRSENGGRGNRAGVPAVNAAGKSAAPRVSASA